MNTKAGSSGSLSRLSSRDDSDEIGRFPDSGLRGILGNPASNYETFGGSRAFHLQAVIMMLYRIFSKRGAQRHIGLLIALIALFSPSARAQLQPPPASQPAPALEPQPSPPGAAQPAPQPLTQEELKQLVGPIALYPDALIALILPASTVPSDLVLAARFVASKGDPAQAANQPWDDSVKSLVRYPDMVKWMDQNLEWTTQLGEAFLDQPADVMNTIQQLRAQARAAGTLVDTPQQKVVEEQSNIRIVPAEPERIYVPQYDPEVVYVQRGDAYSYALRI